MENFAKYSKYYTDESFWKKMSRFAAKAGVKVAYIALLLYYVLMDDAIALKLKVTIVAALGYFIFPIDLIPDFIPVFGYLDDLGVIMATIKFLGKELVPYYD